MSKFKFVYDEYNQKAQDFLKNADALSLEKFSIIEKEQEEYIRNIQKILKTEEYDEKFFTIGNVKNGANKISDTHIRFPKSTLADITEDILQVQVKKEKVSDQSADSISSGSSISDIKENIVFKTENEGMPAPAWIPPKKKEKVEKITRVTRSTRRTKDRNAKTERNSDLIIEIPKTPCISISDTDDSDNEKSENLPRMRSIRAATGTVLLPEVINNVDADSKIAKSNKTKNRKVSTASPKDENCRTTRTKTLRKGKVAENALQIKNLEVVEDKATKAKNEKETKIDKNEDKNIVRTTRTKTLQKKVTDSESQKSDTEANVTESKGANCVIKSKRIRSESSEEEPSRIENKKSKSNSPVQNPGLNGTTMTEYEDARSYVGKSENTAQGTNNILNVTYEHPKVPNIKQPVKLNNVNMNSTITMDSVEGKPIYDIFGTNTPEALITDDESVKSNNTQRKGIMSKPTKVFSPYAKTTTKKKVEAFEKLQSTRAFSKTNSAFKSCNITPIAVKEKGNIFTSAGKFFPTGSSTSKISRLISHQYDSSSSENLLAKKKMQKELRDKQVRNQEKEIAQKKKEAMLQAAAEAKKKLNEEKQLKAQQQRKVIEAEKQKLIEFQKKKEEKLRQREAQREEYSEKKKVENERKLLAQKKKFQEIQMQKKLEAQAKNPPVYMITPAPKLPTNDCYDSDDPEYRNVVPPSWCVGETARRTQFIMLTAGGTIKNTLFCRHAQTPNLQELFEEIDPKKLKRSSSQLWRQPPRYTMMLDLNDTKFSDDDEVYED